MHPTPRRPLPGAVALALTTLVVAGCTSAPPPRPLGLQRAELVPLVTATKDDIAIVLEGEGTHFWAPRTDMLPANAVFIWNNAAPPPPIEAVAPPPAPSRESTLLGTVYFETNSAVLTPAARKTLDQLPESERVSIVAGHADVRGSDRLNDPLSERRAKAVADYLRSRGASVGNVAWHGARQPAATLQKSRRAEMWQDQDQP